MPLRVLDVGCGSGALLDELVCRVPNAAAHVGIDPLPAVLAAATERVDVRVALVCGAAEALPFPDTSFDLVLATLSFRCWHDQWAGVAELARVVTDHGVVLTVEAPDVARGRRTGVGPLLAAAHLRLLRTEVVHRDRLRRTVPRASIASR